ncbi:MAG: IS4 family transposase [bacterium]
MIDVYDNENDNLNPDSYLEETKKWINTEFNIADFNDVRLNKRLMDIIVSFCSSPNTSIPQKYNSWAKIKATYRFLNNKKVSHKNILNPHQIATQKRISEQQIVLAIQDTSILNYTSHPETKGLGNIGSDESIKGMLVHTTLSMTPSRVPLGIIHQQTWIRPYEEYGKKHRRYEKSIQEKESQKWLNSLQATEQLKKDCPDTLIINIGDREADIYELFQQANDINVQSKLLVRAFHNRNVDAQEQYLWSYMKIQPLACTLEVSVPRKKKKAERIAYVELRFCNVTIKPPKSKSNLFPITLNAIYLIEPSPPLDEEPLSWMLLTTLSLNSVSDAVQSVEYYAQRFLNRIIP